MPELIRPRLRHLLLLLVVCAAVVGVGLSAASGQPDAARAVVEFHTTDRDVEPTGRAYLAVQP